jgi:hypothetical protein
MLQHVVRDHQRARLAAHRQDAQIRVRDRSRSAGGGHDDLQHLAREIDADTPLDAITEVRERRRRTAPGFEDRARGSASVSARSSTCRSSGSRARSSPKVAA